MHSEEIDMPLYLRIGLNKKSQEINVEVEANDFDEAFAISKERCASVQSIELVSHKKTFYSAMVELADESNAKLKEQLSKKEQSAKIVLKKKIQQKYIKQVNKINSLSMIDVLMKKWMQVQFGLSLGKCIKTLRQLQEYQEFEQDSAGLLISIENAIENRELSMIPGLLKSHSAYLGLV